MTTPPQLDDTAHRCLRHARRADWVKGLRAAGVVIALAGTGLAAYPAAAHADAVAYLVNVTVRQSYNFPNADAALTYGRDLCGQLAAGVGYHQLVADIERDFVTDDEYQATYLLGQAANELCPAQLWQLRRSAAEIPAA
ncbi:Protein of uncharacterised function (DUF732) [Mycobacteroides abscessus subsp. bolletii]|uniref:DUF732 domain-containing protein n=1 Tax=Mycobacteroides abscessus TaxID=36809 RepID=UPI0009A84093|nr:DUF732 domain-containing protein [Mycobacteroides abscessus]SKG72363.1 Protein of uncharacterised function (DUF732) [Mycobacteroides abscessus subsp. bolletii]SKH10456.1 Protein of uncharacterised function (DUF732) [Mycobacteroides abscessus subsp. bolletii]